MKGFRQGFREIMISGQNTTVSDYASRAKNDKKVIQQINRKLDKLPG
jgi:tRNA A37 methylthiotransferase MiaB